MALQKKNKEIKEIKKKCRFLCKSKHMERLTMHEQCSGGKADGGVQMGGGGVKSVYMFVSLSAFSSMAPLIGGQAA